MKQTILLAGFILLCSCLFSQDSTSKPRKIVPSSATLRTLDGQVTKGWLYNMNDSQVVLLKASPRQLRQLQTSPGEMNEYGASFPVSQIQSISTRKKNSTVKGMLIGLGIGVVTGVVWGLAEGDDPIMQYNPSTYDPFGIGAIGVALNNAFAMTAGEKALTYGAGMGLTGAITGAVIGAIAKKKFTIGGRKEKYRDLQGDLMKRLIVQ